MTGVSEGIERSKLAFHSIQSHNESRIMKKILIIGIGAGDPEYVTVQASPDVPDWIAVGGHMDIRF